MLSNLLTTTRSSALIAAISFDKLSCYQMVVIVLVAVVAAVLVA